LQGKSWPDFGLAQDVLEYQFAFGLYLTKLQVIFLHF